MKHDGSRKHALDQVRALCVHAILRADEYAQATMSAEQREEVCRLLLKCGAHLELMVRIDNDVMRAELRLVEFGEPQFPGPLLTIERGTRGGGPSRSLGPVN